MGFAGQRNQIGHSFIGGDVATWQIFLKYLNVMAYSAKLASKILVAVLAAIIALSSVAIFSAPAAGDAPDAFTGREADWEKDACIEKGSALASPPVTVKPTDLDGYITHENATGQGEHYHPRSQPAAKCAVEKVFQIQNIDAILIVVGSGLTLFSAIMVLLKIAGVGKGSMGGGGGKLKWLLFMILGIILTRPTALLIPTIFFGYRIAQSLGDNIGNLLPWA